MKNKLIAAVIAFVVILISCDKIHKKDDTADTKLAELSNLKEAPPQTKLKQESKIPVGTSQDQALDSVAKQLPITPVADIDWDKKIIKTATLKLEVKDFKGYNDDIHKTVKQFGGYIAQEQQNLSDEKSETIISIKVPVSQFETMMNQLPGGNGNVLEKNISTEDVTGEVVDTKSRLEAKKQMRLKYLEFLKLSKNMEEVLQVQNEINSIQEEIESAAGRVEFLSHQSSYSTINLTFFQPLAGYKPTKETPSFFTRTSQAFKMGTNWIADLFVALISIWPILLIMAGVYIGWKKLKPSKVISQNS